MCLVLTRQVRVLFSKCIDAAERKALARTVTRLGGAVAPDSDEDFTHFVTVPCSASRNTPACQLAWLGPTRG